MSEDQLELNFFDTIGGTSSSGSIIKREMYEMQKSIHGLQMRVKELADENYDLRKKINLLEIGKN
tara:strand:- start:258 stop:452 length:195 start_codon:yes stop_codon:yes gene_type:complete